MWTSGLYEWGLPCFLVRGRKSHTKSALSFCVLRALVMLYHVFLDEVFFAH